MAGDARRRKVSGMDEWSEAMKTQTLPVRGSMTAMVTPFRAGDVDWPAVDQLVERQINGGTSWLVPCGTTGESPVLLETEQDELISRVIQAARGRAPVMAGTGSNCTRKTIERTRRAFSLGANAALVVAPYYNRPSQEGLFGHYAALAEAVDGPIVLYNVPPRTGCSISNDVIARLRERFPHVVALKHATGSVDGVTDLRSRCDIAVLSGDDVITWPLMALGCTGVVSVISNIVPGLVKSLVEAGLRGDAGAVTPLHRKVYDLADGLSRFGPNPVPIKTAMAAVGWIADEFRLPLCPVDPAARGAIEQLLRRHEIVPAR